MQDKETLEISKAVEKLFKDHDLAVFRNKIVTSLSKSLNSAEFVLQELDEFWNEIDELKSKLTDISSSTEEIVIDLERTIKVFKNDNKDSKK